MFMRLTLEVSGRCHTEHQVTARRRSGPLDRIVRTRLHERSGARAWDCGANIGRAQ